MRPLAKAILASPKTTALAILAALTEWGGQVQAYMTGGETDWNQAVTLTLLAIGMLFSRDADKSSQDSGIRPHTPEEH